MPNPPSQAWVNLRHELAYAAGAVGAQNAFVFDAWGLLWCSAEDVSAEDEATARQQIDAMLAGLETPLVQGGHVDGVQADTEPVLWCRNFASVYIFALWFTGPIDELALRRALPSALPRIEGRTAALPAIDPDDPGGGSDPKRMIMAVPDPDQAS